MSEFFQEEVKIPIIYFFTRYLIQDAKNHNRIKHKKEGLYPSDKIGLFAIGLMESLILPFEIPIQIASSIKKRISLRNK